MDASEHITLSLPLLFHILCYAGGMGIMAALLGNALYTRSTTPPLFPAFGRTVFLVVIGSAFYSLIFEGVNAARILLETLLIGLFLAGILLHERCTLKSTETTYQIYKKQMKALLLHVAMMLLILLYFILSTIALFFIFQSSAQTEAFTPAFMITLNGFLIALLYLTHKRITLNGNITKHPMRQSLKIIIWPLLIVLLLLIVPLMTEKYVQSDEFARLQNPPQRLHGI